MRLWGSAKKHLRESTCIICLLWLTCKLWNFWLVTFRFMIKKDNFTQKLLIWSQFPLTLFKLWGQFVRWCIIFVNPKGYCRWMLWRRTALAKNDSGVCGKVRNRGREEHRWSLLGVTRMYMRRSCCCVAECQYGCVQNNVEVTVALGHVLMLWILYKQYLPPTMSSLKYETFRSHLVNKVLRS